MLCPLCFNLTDITEKDGVYRCEYCWGVLSEEEVVAIKLTEVTSCKNLSEQRLSKQNQ